MRQLSKSCQAAVFRRTFAETAAEHRCLAKKALRRGPFHRYNWVIFPAARDRLGMARTWLDRVLSSIADRGRALVRLPAEDEPALDRAIELSRSLVSERGEASGAALARELLEVYGELEAEDRLAFYRFLVESLAPDPAALKAAAEAYCLDPSAAQAVRLAAAAESPRQELLRRMNLAPKGTAMLVQLRADVLRRLREHAELAPLDDDLRHLFASWFNRGFLELEVIDWHTPAAILEKLIAYEAVHEIQGWDDLRRRLAPDRRCFAFFHPALEDEPLIFVEVALVRGMAGAIGPLLAADPGSKEDDEPDTAIFYSISNCQFGLRGISFGNFLIKQVVEELRSEIPSLERFATLSPVPSFRAWFERRLGEHPDNVFRAEERAELAASFDSEDLAEGMKRLDLADAQLAQAARAPLMRLCATYLTSPGRDNRPEDPVARFHLGNGARLERVNFLADTSPRGLRESYGLMVNYLYDIDSIETNHEAFVRQGKVARSKAVDELIKEPKSGRRGAGLLSLAR
jgi:malonyl-CoA decarboxylase